MKSISATQSSNLICGKFLIHIFGNSDDMKFV